jgi:DNA invertase Pin-like site-specific DNA recombinase
MRTWAAANGYEFSDSYRALGVSGFRGKQRQVLQKFFDDVQSGRFPKGDALGVENFDRLSREPPLDSIDLFRQIVKSGVPLVVRGQIYTEETLRREPWRFFEILGELNRAHEESQRKSELLLAANERKRREAREQKKPFGGKRCPGWLRLSDDRGRYVDIPDRVAIVRRIYEESATGLGAPTIAARLNREPIESFDRRKRAHRQGGWHPGYVLSILQDDAVLGTFQPHRYVDGKQVPEGPAIENYFPQVVETALVWRARQSVADRRACGRGRKGHVYANLVSGLGRCPECRAGLILDRKQAHLSYLRCSKSKRGLCDNRAAFPYPRFEETLFRLSDTSLARLIPERPDDTASRRIAELEATIGIKKKNLHGLIAQFGKHAIGVIRDAANAEIEKLGSEIEQFDRELLEIRRQVGLDEHADRKGFLARWREAKSKIEAIDPEERHLARAAMAQEYRRIIYRVVLHPNRVVTIKMKPHDGRWIEYDLAAENVRIKSMGRAGNTLIHGPDIGGFRLIGPDRTTMVVDPYPIRLLRIAEAEPLLGAKLAWPSKCTGVEDFEDGDAA